MAASDTWIGFDSGAAGFFGDTRFFRSLGAPARLAGARRVLGLRAGFLDVLTSPRAFLMFWTLGREIFNALAICEPVLPASTSFFTLARMASVILARLRCSTSRGVFAGRPRFPPAATLTARTKAPTLLNPNAAGNAASSRFNPEAIECSSCATRPLAAARALILSVIIGHVYHGRSPRCKIASPKPYV